MLNIWEFFLLDGTVSLVCREAAAVSKDDKDLGHPHPIPQEQVNKPPSCAPKKVTSLPSASCMALGVELLRKAPPFHGTVLLTLSSLCWWQGLDSSFLTL